MFVSETTQINGKINTIEISDKNIVFNDQPLEIVYQLQLASIWFYICVRNFYFLRSIKIQYCVSILFCIVLYFFFNNGFTHLHSTDISIIIIIIIIITICDAAQTLYMKRILIFFFLKNHKLYLRYFCIFKKIKIK